MRKSKCTLMSAVSLRAGVGASITGRSARGMHASAVLPRPSRASMRAPFSMSRHKRGKDPFDAARWRGVVPSFAAMLMSAPCSRRRETTFVWPCAMA